jgi:uncharacterized membrane protein
MSEGSLVAQKSTAWTDHRVEVIIGTLLRTGVIIAAAVVLAGGVVYVMHHGRDRIDYSTFHSEPESLRKPSEIVHGALGLSGRAIIQLGLLLLIATPVARVAFSAAAFALEHDYMYVFITLIVLAILMYSLFASS